MTSTDVYYDPFDAAIDTNAHPVWKRLRDAVRGPAHLMFQG